MSAHHKKAFVTLLIWRKTQKILFLTKFNGIRCRCQYLKYAIDGCAILTQKYLNKESDERIWDYKE
jgi:hypothetical protein